VLAIAPAAADSPCSLLASHHYFVNGGFFEEEGQLLRDAHILKNIPGTIVQGHSDHDLKLAAFWFTALNDPA